MNQLKNTKKELIHPSECLECEAEATSFFNGKPYCDFHFSKLDELGNLKY